MAGDEHIHQERLAASGAVLNVADGMEIWSGGSPETSRRNAKKTKRIGKHYKDGRPT